MTAKTNNIPAYSAFEKQLKKLCLKEFPCGSGPWREDTSLNLKNLKNTAKIEHRFSITLKDFGAQHEKTETLEEYLDSAKSPWTLDYSWSKEAKTLREIAVKSPWLIDDNFVLNHFKTLRIVNKNVTSIDKNLLKFGNLEELTLSCNFISQIEAKHLPHSLKVLEVCANEVSDLSSLCVQPPELIHLGLGYNKISFVGDYLTGQYWPALLSLDLCNNNLNDLLDVVNRVSSLPKLRNLGLQGNPLSLVPGYRGYTIDSLRKLNILDDIMISADERHHFKGLARKREYILDEAKIKLFVTYIKNIPMPEELKNPEEQPEFPTIGRKYFVQFMFLEDSTLKTQCLPIDNEDFREIANLSDNLASEKMDMLLDHPDQHSSNGDQSMAEKNVFFTESPDVLHTFEKRDDQDDSPSHDNADKIPDEPTETRSVKTAQVICEKYSWSEDIECNWSQMIVRDDLLALRDFLRQGMDISLIEEVVLSYPLIPENAEDGSMPNPKGAELEKESVKDKGGNDKKKKKEPEVELKQDPPTYTTLATWHVSLAEFLEGEFEYQSVLSKEVVEIAPTVHSAGTDSSRKVLKSRGSGHMSSRNSRKENLRKDGKKGDAKDKNKKPPSAGKKKEDPKDKNKEGKASAGKGGKDVKADKGKGGKGGNAVPVGEDEEQGPSPPLEIHVSVSLHHWKTAMDLLKDEEDRKRVEEKLTVA